MGRSPCCEKVGLKKGPWTPEEDQKLLTYIEEHGHGSWRALPAKAGLHRCGKSCRLRWTNYLRPDIKRGKFSLQEEQTIIQLHALLGNRWSAIATHLPKRTDNEIKNYWNTHLKKRLTKMGIDPMTHKPKHHEGLGSGSGLARDTANISHMAQWESARLEAEARLGKESKLGITNAYPLQHHLMISSSPNPAHNVVHVSKAPPALPCLDVLKAWQGAWSLTTKSTIRDNVNSMVFSGGSMTAVDDLESPTSTLNFPHVNNAFNPPPMQNINNIVPCESGLLQDNDNVTYGYTDASAAWFAHNYRSGSIDEEENAIVPTGLSSMIMEDFTDVLVYNSEDHQQNASLGGHISENGVGGNGSCGGDRFDENRSYWNSLLDLVDTSPSGSPVF
ncbi:unnamed protein product [Malus baccata var. baccata]